MNRSDHQRELDEFQSTVDLLRTNRPEASTLELDAVKRRVLARVARPSRPSRPGALMRTRAAIVAMLTLGFAMSTAGAGLAVSGFAGNDQASIAQYPAPPAPQSEVLGEEQTPPTPGAEEQGTPPALPEQQVAPETSGPAPEVQPERQVSTGLQGEELPLTGFAAIPVLLIGLALISVGLVTHRRSRIG